MPAISPYGYPCPPPVSARPCRGILTAMADPAAPRLAVVCRACGYPSSAYVAGKITREGDDDDGPYELSLIQCEYCGSPSLVRQDEASEAAPVEVWPTSQRTLHEGIPCGVRDGVTEARKCFDAGAFLATAVMVRRAIEGFCADQGVNQKILHRALRELVQRNVIDARLLEWADGLRILGNVGAHFTGQGGYQARCFGRTGLDRSHARLCLCILSQFEQFKARRDGPTRS